MVELIKNRELLRVSVKFFIDFLSSRWFSTRLYTGNIPVAFSTICTLSNIVDLLYQYDAISIFYFCTNFALGPFYTIVLSFFQPFSKGDI